MSCTERKTFRHACSKNCFSSCTIISTVENGRIAELQGDPAHPYTKGKLCSKGFALMEMNEHPERLKYPYYQKVKGSGKFTKITWEKAYELIIGEMVNIYKRNKSFYSLGFYKGTGNLGVLHYVTDQFFAGLDGATRIIDSSATANIDRSQFERGQGRNPFVIKDAPFIFIWGANPAATNVHLIPFLIEAKVRGAKVVVIDPLYTQTAELADLYIQIRPTGDGDLARLLLKGLAESNSFFEKLSGFLEDGQSERFAEWIRGIDQKRALLSSGVSEEALHLLLQWLKKKGPSVHVIGNGVFRQAHAEKSICAIEALAAVHGDFGRSGSLVFIKQKPAKIFNNQISADNFSFNGRFLKMSDSWENRGGSPLEMLWISCANPMTQSPNRQRWEKSFQAARFVVTVDHFLTPTAKMANLVLPTTTLFEEPDLVVNDFHQALTFNEKAVAPYFESRSEWEIVRELSVRLEKALPGVHRFSVHSSEEEYLNNQFNEEVYKKYGAKDLSQLKGFPGPYFPLENGEDVMWKQSLQKLINHLTEESGENGEKGAEQPSIETTPPKEYPFWLVTPHHPYRLNSQFHFLRLMDEKEAFVGIHARAARKLGIFDGEIIRISSAYGSVEIKAVYSTQVPEDALFIYEGWHSDTEVEVNRLFPPQSEEDPHSSRTPLHHTFVKVEKL